MVLSRSGKAVALVRPRYGCVSDDWARGQATRVANRRQAAHLERSLTIVQREQVGPEDCGERLSMDR
jgi:hypothetical protein